MYVVIFQRGRGVTKVVTTLHVGRFALCKVITYVLRDTSQGLYFMKD